MMMMQVLLVTAVAGLPKRADKSITGTTAPRRLITPRMQAGIIGTSVRLAYQMISLMHKMLMENISPPSRKVRYCFCSTTGLFSIFTKAFMADSLKLGKLGFVNISNSGRYAVATTAHLGAAALCQHGFTCSACACFKYRGCTDVAVAVKLEE